MNSLSIGLLIAFFGVILILLGQAELTAYKLDISSILRSIGTFLLSAAFLGFLYEIHTKHQFFHEAHKMALGTENLAHSGLCDFVENSKKIDFTDDVKNSKEIWTVFSYSSRFLDDYSEALEVALIRNSKVNMVFLKKESKTLELMRELGWNDDSINASYAKIDSFAERFKDKRLNVVYVDAIPKYSAIILDNQLFYIFNTLSLERQSVPCLVAKKGQKFFDFVKADIQMTFNKFT